ncbi:hypothetical protein MIB92_03465 [Aestuariirhabdus sp. Z084]|uniref:hypothetical protein n=1 Tax=Aestuariirhabdus haliotis TaxID=2918751 RepID=UPI00201B3E8C|nr:hypothetical protein [Aestuariirhabdus haliotis]MCL6414699.1 hypothetical protein [Aestuariirhabdus haliotis]MCL6418631.1 hypothetical protein [Aestuariirhabdus haliotis]
MRIVIHLIFLQFFVLTPLTHAAEQQWQVTPFTQSLSGGPDYGSAEQSGAALQHLCGVEDGSLFLTSGQRIDRISPNGQRWPIAGDEFPGYLDGKAPYARFRMGIGAYYKSHNLACANPALVFIGDTGNRRVRRLRREESGWMVDTIAGGGKVQSLSIGQTIEASQINIGNTFSIALQAQHKIIIASRLGAWSVETNTGTARWLGHWPASTAMPGSDKVQLNLMMGDSDRQGNSYFVSRTPDVVIQIDAKDTIRHFAGVVAKHPKPHHLGDGPPLEAYFDTPNSLAVAPDGSAVYVCGGDEYDIRRIPTVDGEHTQTLMQNGFWGTASRHPNKIRGPAVFLPDTKGTLKPEGKLTVMMVSPLYGRDWRGNLYGGIVPWIGMTQFVDGTGLISTHSFALIKAAP